MHVPRLGLGVIEKLVRARLGVIERLVRAGLDVTDPMDIGGLGFRRTHFFVDRDRTVQIA